MRQGSVEEAEVKRIADYIREIEDGLDKLDCRETTIQRHITKLHLTIERLMDMTCNTKDPQVKVLITTLECKARRCKECIETRLAVGN
jgi:hypothetical protein